MKPKTTILIIEFAVLLVLMAVIASYCVAFYTWPCDQLKANHWTANGYAPMRCVR
jgi:hypothetical protein